MGLLEVPVGERNGATVAALAVQQGTEVRYAMLIALIAFAYGTIRGILGAWRIYYDRMVFNPWT